jgi:hypothetical protein
MVIDDLDIVGARSTPAEADTPLVVDADAVLPCTATRQRFQPVAGRSAQVVKASGNLELPQLPACDAGDSLESPNTFAKSEGSRVVASKRTDHD